MRLGVFGAAAESPGDGIPLVFAERQQQLTQAQLHTAFQEGLQRVSRVVWRAGRGEEPWLERIEAGLSALLELLDEESQWKSLLALGYPLEGACAEECTRLVHGALSEVLSAGRGEVIVGAQLNPPTELVAELLTVGVLSLIRTGILRGDGGPLVDLLPRLMSSVVLAYLGRGAQRADLYGEPGAASKVPPRAEVVPIRPQPQAMLALRTIAALPRSSNAEICRALGIDARQTSNVLKPLAQRGLIENTTPSGRGSREQNAWQLTAYGRRVFEVISDSFTVAHRREEQHALPKRTPRHPAKAVSTQPDRPARSAA